MSYQIAEFTGQVEQTVKRFKWYPGNRVNELNAICNALASDTTKRDITLETPLKTLTPGHHKNTSFANAVLHVINKGKAGNLSPVAMSNAITAALSEIFPPVNTAPPVISGTASVGSTLSSTVGTWTYVPTSYSRQWRRGAIPIAGATGATYVLVAADSGTTVTMQLIAHNAAGDSAPIISNGLAIA